MPEVDVLIRWPDGARQHLVSPSRSITGVLMEGASYPVEEFVRRTTGALILGSERVRQRYGFACSAAEATRAGVEARAATQPPQAPVIVDAISVRGTPPPAPTRELRGHHAAVIVGGGQAGLAASWYLREHGIEHLVLERDVAFSDWRRRRWDAFSLVTPNWQCQLPGHPYDGDDPDGFMVRDELLGWLDRYLAKLRPPLLEGVAVTCVAPREEGGFTVRTSHGDVTTDAVVLAVGGYHRPAIPSLAAQLPAQLTQLHSAQYRNAAVLPDGGVLVVGSGQSGAQIAEDLHLAGRTVHLAVGDAPRVARRHRGRDVVAWLHDMGHYDLSISEHPEGNAARQEANHYVTGRDGGRDLDLRKLATEGLQLHGRLLGADEGALQFVGGLAASLDAADATYARINASIDRWIQAQGLSAEPGHPYEPCWAPADDGPTRVQLDTAGITSVIWATGFRKDWSWVQADWLAADGWPDHQRGVTRVPGLFVLGLPWLHTWGSGRFAAIDRDAGHVARAVRSCVATPAH